MASVTRPSHRRAGDRLPPLPVAAAVPPVHQRRTQRQRRVGHDCGGRRATRVGGEWAAVNLPRMAGSAQPADQAHPSSVPCSARCPACPARAWHPHHSPPATPISSPRCRSAGVSTVHASSGLPSRTAAVRNASAICRHSMHTIRLVCAPGERIEDAGPHAKRRCAGWLPMQRPAQVQIPQQPCALAIMPMPACARLY